MSEQKYPEALPPQIATPVRKLTMFRSNYGGFEVLGGFVLLGLIGFLLGSFWGPLVGADIEPSLQGGLMGMMVAIWTEHPRYFHLQLFLGPKLPYFETGLVPGKNIALEPGLEQSLVERAIDYGRILGRTLASCTDCLIIGESIPGGTTTALAVWKSFGINAHVSSSMPNNPESLKNEIVEVASNVIVEFVENSDSFSERDWKELYKLSEDTFVEETESLKQSGAGAGLTDND